ncbi:MAG: tripartite tricarboxylate transporter substrate binding protein [Bradyrhizobiaceae bacterium]|nr:tripartite tricarboxylate transporter substrate binding protein [Bradyrhizobiaceae bacterium]
MIAAKQRAGSAGIAPKITLLEEDMLSRRDACRFIGASMMTGMVPAFSHGARAQVGYPDRPVRIVVPYGPGGVADVSTRLVAAKLSERLGQSFFIDNRPGPGGITAAKATLNFPADGYTLYLTGNGAAISESLFASLPFDIVRDFASISLLAQFDILLATKIDGKLDTIQKLVAYAKENPGKLNFGSIAVGSTQNLSLELFKMATGVNVASVNFRTTPDLITAIIRGDVDVGFDYYAALSPATTGKQIKVIATSGAERSKLFDHVPTVKEAGYPDYIVTSWNALSARAGTPTDIIGKLNSEIKTVLQSPEIRAQMANLGMEPIASTPEALSRRLMADIDKWRVVINTAGIPKQ